MKVILSGIEKWGLARVSGYGQCVVGQRFSPAEEKRDLRKYMLHSRLNDEAANM